MAPHRLRPYPVYLGLELTMSLLNAVAQTTVIVYWVSTAQLNPLQLLLLGTALEAAYLVFQLPTGVFADRATPAAGRRRVAVLGAALVYGALEAWIAAELPEAEMTHTYVRATQIGLVGAVAGSLLSGIVMLEGTDVPLLVGGAGILVLAAVLAVVMPESAREPDRDLTGVAEQVRETGRSIRAVPGLVLLFAMTAFVGMWSESFDRLWGDFFIVDIRFPEALSDGEWFSVLAAGVAVVALGSTELAKRRAARQGPGAVTGTLTAFLLVSAGCVVVMATAHTFGLALAAYLGVAAIRPVYEPLVSRWMVKKVPEQVRATALSAREMCDSTGQIAGGPVFGLVGLWVSVRAALLVGAAVLGPAAALLAGAGRPGGAGGKRHPGHPVESAGCDGRSTASG